MAKASHNKSLRLKSDESSESLMARLFLRFYAHEQGGLSKSDINANQLASWLTEQGYPTKSTLVRSAGKSKLIEAAVPLTELTIKLAILIKSKFPSFEIEKLFEPIARESLRAALSSQLSS
jgi:hypothetical protein